MLYAFFSGKYPEESKQHVFNVFITIFMAFSLVKCLVFGLSFIHESSYLHKCDKTIWKRRLWIASPCDVIVTDREGSENKNDAFSFYSMLLNVQF